MLPLTLRETDALNRLSSFKNLRRKGGKFDHRLGRPKVLLRHWDVVADVGVPRSEDPKLIIDRIIFQATQPVWTLH